VSFNLGKLKTVLGQNSVTRYPYLKTVRYFHRFKRAFPIRYTHWIKHTESFVEYEPSNKDIRFHLVLLATNNDIVNHKQIVQSIVEQRYPHWHLDILVAEEQQNDSMFTELANMHPQITIATDNKRVLSAPFAEAENSSSWHIILTQHFILSPHCLTELNVFINNQSIQPVLVYTDHDELGTSNKRQNPWFKPRWNADLFYSQEYIQHCCVFNTTKLDLPRINSDGFSRDMLYQLVLELSQSSSDSIAHLPKIMFHKVKELDSLDPKMVEESLNKCVTDDQVKISQSGGQDIRIHWPLNDTPLVTLIIPTRNGYEILKQAIDSICDKTTYKNFEMLIVDNQSDCERTLAYLSSLQNDHANIRVIEYNHEFNYSGINNYAVTKANGSVIGFINNDIEVISSNWLNEMLSHALRSDIGCVGAKLYYPNDTIQHAGVIVGMWGCAGHSHKHFKRDSRGYCDRLMHVQNYSALTAACLLLRKELFEQVNGFNELDLPVQFNDVDLCLKVASLGYRNVWTPYAELYHHESISRGEDVSSAQITRSRGEVKYMHETWVHLSVKLRTIQILND